MKEMNRERIVMELRWLRPRLHRHPDRTMWSVSVGDLGLTWEVRYYRTTGLQLWIGDRMFMLWRTTVEIPK